MVTKATDQTVTAIKSDMAEKKRLEKRLSMFTLKRLSEKHDLSIRQILRIARGEQRGKVK